MKKKKDKSIFREYFELITEVLIFVLFINAFLLQTYAIPTSSMEDNMLIGDHLIVDKVSYSKSLNSFDSAFLPQVKLKTGMIVTFKAPPEVKRKNLEKLWYVKRIIGLPGETLQVVDKKVYINDELLDEPYVVFKKGISFMDNFPEADYWDEEFPEEFRDSLVDTDRGNGKAFLIPEGYYFCMGDNRNFSSDSRVWGPVPGESIVGKPWLIYWSYETDTNEIQDTSPSGKLKGILSIIPNLINKTRWNRTLKKY
jgi:signal peptidase I